MSAYDKKVSDAIYGTTDRYVSNGRLLAMLDHEYDLLIERLPTTVELSVFALFIAVLVGVEVDIFKDGRLDFEADVLAVSCLDVAAEADVPVAVHTGYWGDFRELDPKFLLGIAARRATQPSIVPSSCCVSNALAMLPEITSSHPSPLTSYRWSPLLHR